MSASPPVRVLIVDDEPLAVERLAELVARIPGFEVAGCESRPARVLERCKLLKPDVVLMDIEMPGRSGLELATDLRRQTHVPAIIFVTAHDDFALKAFDVAAIDYVVKPVRRERLAESLRRVADARGQQSTVSGRLGERLMRVGLDEVRAFTAEDKCTVMHAGGRRILVDDPLKVLEERYADRFVRIHRNALVSRAHLRALYHDGNDLARLEVEGLEFDPEVSRRNLPAVRNLLSSG